ncbi:ATP-binding cassette domain-containing protein [Limisphaera sp. VF-2]|uniref:ATP-binding cassette domain-containing protein n=1 Tax=Limisphaera sp. VF-2 TaxID=3400418 RepID=UPI003C27B681
MNDEPATGQVLLQMDDVEVGCFHDPHRVVLRHVHWRVSEGDFWIVAGFQGSGRTDFLLTAAGLLPARAGRIQWFGQPAPQTESARLTLRRRLGLVFEDGRLLSELTVFENLALPLAYHGIGSDAEIARAVANMLDATELGPWAHRRSTALPRAWQRRAGLARALMLQPRLLLVDCPLQGLDRRHAGWWLAALEALHAGRFPGLQHPLTLVVTAEDPAPWRSPGRTVAWLEQQQLKQEPNP